MSFIFKLPETATAPAPKGYDHLGAAQELLRMMRSKSVITVEYYVNRDGEPMATVESARVARFSVRLTPKTGNDIICYLHNAAVPLEDYVEEDVARAPPFDGDSLDLQEAILRQCVSAGWRVQWVPAFRERGGRRTAILNLRRGKIVFHVRKSEELTDFLCEQERCHAGDAEPEQDMDPAMTAPM